MKVDSYAKLSNMDRYQGVQRQQGRVLLDSDENSENKTVSSGITRVSDKFTSYSVKESSAGSSLDPEWKYLPIRRFTK